MSVTTMSAAAKAAQDAARQDNGQFGEQYKAEPSGGVLTVVSGGPVDPDVILTGPDSDDFSQRAVDRLQDDYWNAAGTDRWNASENLSVVRAKRLADLAAHHYPQCATIQLEPDCDGNDNVTICGLLRADGSRIDADWDDRYDQLVDEARDLYGANRTWQRLAATEDPGYWYLNVAKAQAFTRTDRGLPQHVGEPGMHGIRGVPAGTTGAYTCGACGRSWMEDTPAGRCPWEYDHTDED